MKEIQRLTEALAQSDKLVKQVQQKFEDQLANQMQMKELLISYEAQLKAKDQQIGQIQSLHDNENQSRSASLQQLDNLQQQVASLNVQLSQRDQLLGEIQAQLEKEQRLRGIAERQLSQSKMTTTNIQASAVPRTQVNQSLGYSQTLPEPSTLSTTGYATRMPQAKAEIRDLIRQLDQSLGDE